MVINNPHISIRYNFKQCWWSSYVTTKFTSLCGNPIVSSYFLWTSSLVYLFDFFTFDIFYTFWHRTYYLNQLSPSQGYFLLLSLCIALLSPLLLVFLFTCATFTGSSRGTCSGFTGFKWIGVYKIHSGNWDSLFLDVFLDSISGSTGISPGTLSGRTWFSLWSSWTFTGFSPLEFCRILSLVTGFTLVTGSVFHWNLQDLQLPHQHLPDSLQLQDLYLTLTRFPCFSGLLLLLPNEFRLLLFFSKLFNGYFTLTAHLFWWPFVKVLVFFFISFNGCPICQCIIVTRSYLFFTLNKIMTRHKLNWNRVYWTPTNIWINNCSRTTTTVVPVDYQMQKRQVHVNLHVKCGQQVT